ncbi:hypothetical protein LINPERHAP2_LOCUS33256, partial [Linum perenne]
HNNLQLPIQSTELTSTCLKNNRVFELATEAFDFNFVICRRILELNLVILPHLCLLMPTIQTT